LKAVDSEVKQIEENANVGPEKMDIFPELPSQKGDPSLRNDNETVEQGNKNVLFNKMDHFIFNTSSYIYI
jgi:hypothetical protein